MSFGEEVASATLIVQQTSKRLVKYPNIVAVRFIGLFKRASFIVETSTVNHYFTTLLCLPKFIRPKGLNYIGLVVQTFRSAP